MPEYELKVRCLECQNQGTLLIEEGMKFTNALWKLPCKVGEYPNTYTPTCPKCGSKLLVREKNTGK